MECIRGQEGIAIKFERAELTTRRWVHLPFLPFQNVPQSIFSTRSIIRYTPLGQIDQRRGQKIFTPLVMPGVRPTRSGKEGARRRRGILLDLPEDSQKRSRRFEEDRSAYAHLWTRISSRSKKRAGREQTVRLPSCRDGFSWTAETYPPGGQSEKWGTDGGQNGDMGRIVKPLCL